MCLVRIGRKLKNGLVWITERGYKTITGTLFLLWMIGVLLNPPITMLLTAIWVTSQAAVTYSWRKVKGGAQWTIGTIWMQISHYLEGRRRYKETRREEKYGK